MKCKKNTLKRGFFLYQKIVYKFPENDTKNEFKRLKNRFFCILKAVAGGNGPETVSFTVYPSWHLMRQAALDPDKRGKCRKARSIFWVTRGPRRTVIDCAFGLTPANVEKTA
jgi:hypothetical protein